MRSISPTTAIAMVSTFAPVAASAADIETPYHEPGGSDWVIQVTPYLWATGMEGDVSPFRDAPTIRIEKSFSDVVEDLNLGGFLNVWARNGRFVISGDLMYVDTTSVKSTRVLPDLFPGGLELNAKLDSTEFYAALQVGYRLIDTPQFTFDALAGGRFWDVSNDVDIRVDTLGTISRDENFSWFDPILGMRAFLNITDDLSVLAQSDIGGFGAGSDLTWSVLGTLNYILSDHWSASAGYRHMEVDYDRNDYVFDVELSGPVLGVTYRF